MIEQKYLIAALDKLTPNAEWIMRGNDIEWLDTTQAKPSTESIEQAIEEIKNIEAQTEYQRQRSAAYPSIGDQLDALYHAGLFPEDMAAKIKAVKDRYPKGVV